MRTLFFLIALSLFCSFPAFAQPGYDPASAIEGPDGNHAVGQFDPATIIPTKADGTVVTPPVVAPPPAAPSGFALAFWQYIFPILLSAVGGVILWLGKLGAAFIRGKVESLDQSTAAAKFAHAGEKLFTLALNVTADINTRLKPQLTAYMADGVLSDAEKAQLKEEAKKLLLSSIAPEMMVYLRGTLGGAFDSVISGVIERAVVAVKPTSPTVAPAPAAVPSSP